MVPIKRSLCRFERATDVVDRVAEGFETLPLARVRRAGNEEATPELDHDYFPPLLAIDAWPDLYLGTIRAIMDLLGSKMEIISQRVSERGLNLTSQEPGDLDDLLMLHEINRSWSVLRPIAYSVGIHPFYAYSELCRIVGQLSLFDPSRRVDPQLPTYDHDDLGRIFRWLQRRIGELLGTAKKLDTSSVFHRYRTRHAGLDRSQMASR